MPRRGPNRTKAGNPKIHQSVILWDDYGFITLKLRITKTSMGQIPDRWIQRHPDMLHSAGMFYPDRQGLPKRRNGKPGHDAISRP